ncbi:permease [Luteolibacter flavescens]|uniref:Permease n=1 Tax=Luteolibacter flavescens TaxID=1859460 RepID=A0ABT3FK80_9BACT|nr:permease [Luteolibacter flavescens]MCW1883852.1 permease [Luteolibacter flavescens]
MKSCCHPDSPEKEPDASAAAAASGVPAIRRLPGLGLGSMERKSPVPSCCVPQVEESQAKPSCCGGGGEEEQVSSCCAPTRKTDWILWGSLVLVTAGIAGHFIGGGPAWWHTFAHGSWEFMSKAWWGLLAGIVAVGVIGRMPQELISGLLGRAGSFGGILRAVLAGTLLDLCNHGILMVGAQLYKKGASLGQTLAFLVASPWNSLSLTLILAALVGWKWMLLFIALSMVIGVATGWLADRLVKRGVLPANPNHRDLPEDFRFRPAFREAFTQIKPTRTNLKAIAIDGLRESRMILRWIFFGVVLAAAIRAFVPTEIFSQYFGPSLLGLALTLIATTAIEVCSEGSSPVAADLLTRAAAPGNAFTFLMAGAATDYTEIMVLRETTKSWKAAFVLPLLTVPQVLVLAWLLNQGAL